MIESLIVTNYLGESMKLVLSRPELCGIYIASITGLGPVKADIHTTNTAISDGSDYNSARATERNIVITFGFLDPVEENRHKVYKFFPIKKRVELSIKTDQRVCKTYGYVESDEPNIFSEQELTQVSIVCPDSYFYAEDELITNFYSSTKSFEFPLENNDLHERLIELGTFTTDAIREILYEGDVENGFTIIVKAIGQANGFIISNDVTNEKITLDNDRLTALTGAGISSDDVITISTENKHRSITLSRLGKTINIRNCIEKNPDWFQLSKGVNVFSIHSLDGLNNLLVKFVTKTLYEGV